MRRIAVLALVIVASATGPASVVSATGPAHRGAPVRGHLRGEVTLTPNVSGCIGVTAHDGRMRATVLGRAAYDIDACVYSASSGTRVAGLMTITERRSTLEGRIDQTMDEQDVTVEITGGTGRFRRATGSLVLQLEPYDQSDCYPQAGICFKWKERGDITVRLRLGR